MAPLVKCVATFLLALTAAAYALPQLESMAGTMIQSMQSDSNDGNDIVGK